MTSEVNQLFSAKTYRPGPAACQCGWAAAR
jgi:hypothetical protein